MRKWGSMRGVRFPLIKGLGYHISVQRFKHDYSATLLGYLITLYGCEFINLRAKLCIKMRFTVHFYFLWSSLKYNCALFIDVTVSSNKNLLVDYLAKY